MHFIVKLQILLSDGSLACIFMKVRVSEYCVPLWKLCSGYPNERKRLFIWLFIVAGVYAWLFMKEMVNEYWRLHSGDPDAICQFKYFKEWAASRDLQQCGILTWIDSDEPVQPPFKLRNSKWCSVSSITVIGYSSDKKRLWSDCAYARYTILCTRRL